MASPSTTGASSSETAQQSLANEQARQLGAGSFFNVLHLLGDLDYLKIQEASVRAPLSVRFITTPLIWYYIRSGSMTGVFLSSGIIVARGIAMVSILTFPEYYVYPIFYFFTAFYMFELASYLIKRPIYHFGAHTKAVSLVFISALSSLIGCCLMKSAALLAMIYFKVDVVNWLLSENHVKTASWIAWLYDHLLGHIYVEFCFMTICLIVGATLYQLFELRLRDLKTQYEQKRPYMLASQNGI